MTELTLGQVARTIEQDSVGKIDYLTPVSNIRAGSDGRLSFVHTHKIAPQRDTSEDMNTYGAEVHPFGMTEWAESQLLTRLGMPVAYFRKVFKEDPDLYMNHVNYWLSIADGTVRIRAKTIGERGPHIRGIVSDQYTPFDNVQLIDLIDNLKKNMAYHVQFESMCLESHRLHLRMTLPDTRRTFGVTDENRIGFDFLNSEVGASSVAIQAMIYRLICSNGMKAWTSEGDGFRHRHIHIDRRLLERRAGQSIAAQLEGSEGILQDFGKSRDIPVNNPLEVIEKVAKASKLSDKFIATAKDEFEGDRSAYGVINSFTRAARELDNAARLEAEAFAGKLLKMSVERWHKLDTERIDVYDG